MKLFERFKPQNDAISDLADMTAIARRFSRDLSIATRHLETLLGTGNPSDAQVAQAKADMDKGVRERTRQRKGAGK